MELTDLISSEYRAIQIQMHNGLGYGGSGYKHAAAVIKMARQLGATCLLDYGCGEGTLKREFAKLRISRLRIREYDPGVEGKDRLPSGAELVVCTDVLEHVEPNKLDRVLSHIVELAGKGAYLSIATRPANKLMPNGDNAHLIIEGPYWWMGRIAALPWRTDRVEIKTDHSLTFWISR